MIVIVRLLEEVQRVHFLRVERILEARRDVGDLGDVDREQENVRDVDLPRPLQDARAGDDEAALEHGAAVDEGRGVAGYEDEDFGRVAEANTYYTYPVSGFRSSSQRTRERSSSTI